MASGGAKMRKAIETLVLPVLKRQGFRGEWPHYRNKRDDAGVIDLISFQFDKYGGGFVAEISQCERWRPRDWFGNRIGARTVTSHHMPPGWRLRLGARKIGGEHWFRYDKSDDPTRFAKLAQQVLARIEKQAAPFWTSRVATTKKESLVHEQVSLAARKERHRAAANAKAARNAALPDDW